MASTRFGKPSGASVAALLLMVAVLVGSFAPGAQAQVFNLTVENYELCNDVNYTVSAPELPVGSGITFPVPANRSTTVTIQAAQSLSSSTFIVKVLGGPPLGGNTYLTNGEFLSRVISFTGLTVKILKPCKDDSGKPGLTLEVYSMLPLVTERRVFSTCALLQKK